MKIACYVFLGIYVVVAYCIIIFIFMILNYYRETQAKKSFWTQLGLYFLMYTILILAPVVVPFIGVYYLIDKVVNR